MNKIGIICAMESELDELLQGMDSVEEVKIVGIKFYCGSLNDKEIILSLCGVGKVNASMATTVLIERFNCDLIINSGIAGGVSPLKKRDSVIATKLMYHDVDVTGFGYPFGQVPGYPKEFIVNPSVLLLVKKIFTKLNLIFKTLPIVSGDKFVTSREMLSGIDYTDGYAVEMEGAAIAQVCVKAGVDFVVIRYISDIIGEENQEEEYSIFEAEMSKRSALVTLEFLKNICC